MSTEFMNAITFVLHGARTDAHLIESLVDVCRSANNQEELNRIDADLAGIINHLSVIQEKCRPESEAEE